MKSRKSNITSIECATPSVGFILMPGPAISERTLGVNPLPNTPLIEVSKSKQDGPPLKNLLSAAADSLENNETSSQGSPSPEPLPAEKARLLSNLL